MTTNTTQHEWRYVPVENMDDDVDAAQWIVAIMDGTLMGLHDKIVIAAMYEKPSMLIPLTNDYTRVYVMYESEMIGYIYRADVDPEPVDDMGYKVIPKLHRGVWIAA